METNAIIADEWPYVLNMMPADLEGSARAKLAIVRKREVQSAGDLLRLALCYGLCDLSLRETAAWAKLLGIGELSAPAVFKRLKGAADWLGHLVLEWMQERGLAMPDAKMAVRILDATAISTPGSTGTDWRVHLGLDLARLRITSVELTGPEGGETLVRHQIRPHEIVVGDRGYGHRAGIAHALEARGHVVIRINWQNFPLEAPSGAALDILSCLEILGAGEVGDWPVQFRANDRIYSMRLVALRKSEAAAEEARKRIRYEATRKGRTPHPDSLRAAAFVFVVTDLPTRLLPTVEVLELYRLRWQVEIFFKRLKSISHIDHLRAKDSELARTYIYANILGALILDELCSRALVFFPWGYPLIPAGHQPVGPATDVC